MKSHRYLPFSRFALAALCVAPLSYARPARALEHPCAPDARKRAKALFDFHRNSSAGGTPEATTPQIGPGVKTLPAIHSLKGPKQFDVLEVWARENKGEYRMRFIYYVLLNADPPPGCVLMGQEILESAAP